jgi:hypothetical protein
VATARPPVSHGRGLRDQAVSRMIGMFGPSGGWGIPITPPTLMITVGGITTKPRYINGSLQPQEMLDVPISLDHDLC